MAIWTLILEAFAVYCLVLGVHSLRHRFGLAPFYALLGGVTAVMSWVTDAGVLVQAGGITFLVGSTVFYTSILLGVFVVYVFDGPRATRIAISTVVGVSTIVPIIALVLHIQMKLMGSAPLGFVPIPSLRINIASVLATLMDLIFLAVTWEFFNIRLGRLHPAVRAFLTLLGVMWLDVILFNVWALAGNQGFFSTLSGTLISRAVVCLFATPLLWLYLSWQDRSKGATPSKRPLMAIIRTLTEVEGELDQAKEEIARRRETERQLRLSEERLALALEVTEVGVYDFKLPFSGDIYLSERWQILHGFESGGFLSPEKFMTRLESIFHPDDLERFKQAYADMAEGKTPGYEVEYRIKGPDGNWVEMMTYAKAVEGSRENRRARVVGVALDITEYNRAERLVRERTKLEGVMEMAGAACHELNQPLQVLFGQAELMDTECKERPEIAKRIESIQEQLTRLQEITQKIQGITRYETKDYAGDTRIIDLSRSSDPE